MVGMLAVLGVAARNGILLVHHYQHLEEVEGMPFGAELALRGASERLAPILMTSLAFIFGVTPMVWAVAVSFATDHRARPARARVDQENRE